MSKHGKRLPKRPVGSDCKITADQGKNFPKGTEVTVVTPKSRPHHKQTVALKSNPAIQKDIKSKYLKRIR